MRRVLRPLVVFGVTSGLTLAAFQFTIGGAHGSGTRGPAGNPLGFSMGYELAELELLEPTLYHIEENYVEPSRVDYEAMYVAALEAVERRVPVCMFRREVGGKVLAVEIGEFRTVLEVDTITSRRELHGELKNVARLLQEHLDPADIPSTAPVADPLAEVEYALVNGVLGTLDPHSILLPPEQSREMDVDNQGEFGGLGITIVDRQGRLTIEYPLKDTPAERAGLKPDDHIVRIDGESTINMSLDDAVGRLRGKVGAPVMIEVMREGLSKPMPIRIVREKIRINPVEGDILEGGIGYVSIKNFHSRVETDLRDELARLNRESGGLEGLVLDLRSNPGGYLTQAEAVSDTFLWDGDIVSTVDGNGRKRNAKRASAAGTESRYPIAVLVNASSASASEIVAGALRNNERAVIIGERTFGKGSVQNLHPFFDDSKLKITISQYWTPGDKSIQSVGIPADIELRPAVVSLDIDEATGERDEVARLFFRERVRREADLDKHLEQQNMRVEEPAYVVRYLHDGEGSRRRGANLDLASDQEVQFAREILLAAPSYHRAEILAASASVVSRHRRAEEQKIEEAFESIGIDWSMGPEVAEPALDVRFDLGEHGALIAGEEQTVSLVVTNTGAQPIYRLAAIGRESEVLDGREFIFGKLAPGETRRFEQDVKLVAGYPSEVAPVTFAFRDVTGVDKISVDANLPVEGVALPKLAWSWSLDDAVVGNADGAVSVGEKVTLDLTVENRGAGPSVEAFARIKNHSGKTLDIVRGTVEPGYMVDSAGEACEVLAPGVEWGTVVGDPSADQARVDAADPPEYAEGCTRILAAGQSWTGSFELEVREQNEEGYELELTLGDSAAYDHASVVRAGFYSYFTQQEDIVFSVDEPLPEAKLRVPPAIEISRKPNGQLETPHTTVSGVVSDDSGVAHVMVFAREDKIFYQGRGRNTDVRSIPFTADVTLDPGLNTITVLATDRDGFTHTQSVVTWYDAPEQHAAAPIE